MSREYDILHTDMGKEQVASRENGVTLEELEHVFRLSFSPAILADPTGWTPEYPAFGHCSAVTQIVNDLFGGEIHGFWFNESAGKWGGKIRGSHFVNVLPNGQRVDFTRSLNFRQTFLMMSLWFLSKA